MVSGIGIRTWVKQQGKKASSDNIIDKLDNTNRIFFLALKTSIILLLIGFIVYFSWSASSWLFSDDECIVIQPFMICNESSLSGSAIADLLRYDLQKIKEINEQVEEVPPIYYKEQNRKQFDVNYPTIKPPAASLSNSLANIGNIGMDKTSVSVGYLLSSLKELRGNHTSTIKGSLQKYGNTMKVVAILEDHHAGKADTAAWATTINTTEGNTSIDGQILDSIEDLAFQISHGISNKWSQSKDDNPKDYKTLMHLTHAKEAFLGYIGSRNPSYLDKAYGFAILANCSEPLYKGTFDFLSNLGFAYLDVGLTINSKYISNSKDIFKNISKVKTFDSCLDKGLVYFYSGDLFDAVCAFNESSLVNPKSEDACNYEGMALRGLGRYNEAINAFNKTLSLNSTNTEAIVGIGAVLFDEKDYEIALKYFKEAIRINSKAEWFYDKGLTLYYLNRYSESIKAYGDAIKLDPEYIFAWNNRGWNFYEQGNYHEALDNFYRVYYLDSNNSYGLANLGLTIARSGENYSFANQLCDRAIIKDPQNPGVLTNKGEILRLKENYSGAIDYYLSAIKKDPYYDRAFYSMGLAYYEKGDYPNSLYYCDKAIEINPRYGKVWYTKGLALKAMGENFEDAFAKANDLRPN